MKPIKPETTEETIQIYKESNPSERILMEKIFGKEPFKDVLSEWKEVFQNFCKENNIDFDAFMKKYSILEDSGIARQMIKTINGIINSKWKVNHRDKKQEKWFPVFTYDDKTGFGLSTANVNNSHSFTHIGSRLCNENSKTAELVGRKFLKIWEVLITTED